MFLFLRTKKRKDKTIVIDAYDIKMDKRYARTEVQNREKKIVLEIKVKKKR